MTQQAINYQMTESPGRRGRGPNKPFPVLKFEEVLKLPQAILEHGVNGQLRRITLFDRLEKSPESGPSRQLIITASRYGLTSGGIKAEYIAITETGSEILKENQPTSTILSKKFECAISKFELFRQTHEKLVNQRVPAEDVLADMFAQASLPPSDIRTAAGVFVANLRHLGLVRQISGSERIISIEHLLEDPPKGNEDSPPEPLRPTLVAADPLVAEGNAKVAISTNRPALHIDIQVHIDPTSNAEQIDQIFASMAKHLYGNES